MEGLRPPSARAWLNEPRRPTVIRTRERAFWLAVAAVCIGAAMGQLDASIVTVALPTLQVHFGVSLGSVTWVGLSYLLVLVATVAAVGRLADMVGRKLLYTYGFVIFTVGSALCGVSTNLWMLNGFRVLQAVGAAMLQANSVAIIVLAVPRLSLGKAIGIQGAAQAIGLAIGPTIGGLLLAAWGWRWIFFVNVPLGVLGTVAAVVCIPRSRFLQERVSFDWIGLGLFFPGVVALLSAVTFGDTSGWTSSRILALGAAAVVLLVAFVVRESITAHPMIDPALFRSTPFTAGITSGLLAYLVMFGVLFLIPYFAKHGLGLGSAQSGAELMVMPLLLGMTAPFAGRLADRFGPRALTATGMVVVALGLVAAGLWGTSTTVLLTSLGAIGVGLGLFTPPNNAAVMGSVDPAQSGLASGVLNMTRGLGTSLGLALTGLVLTLAGGAATERTARHSFTIAALFLAGVSLVAGGLAAARGATSLSGQSPEERSLSVLSE